jgi:hypothetical protein
MMLFAGVLALATVGYLAHAPRIAHAADQAGPQIEGATKINIVRIKNTLKLTAAQKRHWPPVEAALVNIARQQARKEPDGAVKRFSRRAMAIVFDSAAVAKLAAAARPLVGVLDDEQKQAALVLAREMGFGWVLAKLN